MLNVERKLWFDPKIRKVKRHRIVFYCPLFNTTLSGCNMSCNPCLAYKHRSKATIVVNADQEEYDVYIGRGTKWGNKYHIGTDGTREECIQKFKNDFVNNPKLQFEAIKELQGMRLGCHCKPLPCHGDVYVEYIEWDKNKRGGGEKYV